MHSDRIWTLMSRKLSGEATEAELFELNNLVNSNPGIDIPVQYINEFWQVPAETDEEFLEATFHLHSQRLKEKGFDLELEKDEAGSLNLVPERSRKIKRAAWAVAAVVIIAAVVFAGQFYPTASGNAPEKMAQAEVSTKDGSRTKIQLPDGTSVWLNSSSKLVYDNERFRTGVREVTLSGEAYFDVVKNTARPFVIHTEKMDIRVLGTAFNVKCYPGDKHTETSLIRGSIEVTLKDRSEKIMMKPNEKLVLNNEETENSGRLNTAKAAKTALKAKPIIELGHLTFYPSDSSIVETGWVNNRLVFTEETFLEIAKKMERWYGITIVITNEKLKKELLTGIFEKETINDALKALQFTTPFTYRIDKDIITISK
jgi:transmembrane sensor